MVTDIWKVKNSTSISIHYLEDFVDHTGSAHSKLIPIQLLIKNTLGH